MNNHCRANDKESRVAHPSRMKRKKAYKKQETKGWIFSLVAAIVVALLFRIFVFEFIFVDGDSMNPTLIDEEYIFMEKITSYFDEPSRGDIVICTFPGRTETFVKRVVGIEGDVLRITDGVLYINGEQSFDYFEKAHASDFAAVTVPQNTVFVMGDNRNNSHDSRNVGALSYDRILGKAVFVLWPLDNIHGLS